MAGNGLNGSVAAYFGATKKPRLKQSRFEAYPAKDKRAGLLSTLKDAGNPLTDSSCPERGFHLVSGSSGHQMSNGVRPREHEKSWSMQRNAKLKAQGAEAETNIFAGVRVYINGETGSETVNLQLIKAIQSNGGTVSYAMSKSGCTHVICENNLSGKKTNDEFHLQKAKLKIVRPAWVMDSVAAGRRLPESTYPVLFQEAQPAINRLFVGEASSSAMSRTGSGSSASSGKMVDDDLAWLSAREVCKASISPAPEEAPPSAQERRRQPPKERRG